MGLVRLKWKARPNSTQSAELIPTKRLSTSSTINSPLPPSSSPEKQSLLIDVDIESRRLSAVSNLSNGGHLPDVSIIHFVSQSIN